MNPFYFGASAAPLFGVLHPSSGEHQRSAGVVLCAAARDEYNPSHRSLRQLATRLARAGFPVLRFDFSGSGDSYGDDDQSTVEQWRSDIDVALTELVDTTSVQQSCLIGLRLGGTLAALAAKDRNDVTGLALWDPVVTGQAYVDELYERHRDLVVNVLRQHNGEPSEEDGLFGFSMGETLRGELVGLDLSTVPVPATQAVFLVTTRECPDYDLLESRWRSARVSIQRARLTAQPIWEERALWSNELVPSKVLEQIVSWVSERYR